ncbi:type II toxin-antitoxin system PemK/MazF family toxin [Blastococcus sp. BMG 814]|uniref:Type II toxin-antitoxin system PemK/MazF family toxin n=1 Tax=Blastococcus carthaginiensis TaxID=3050034 RepID=A0ABT9IG89_9ACTN|nr:type II toxin-antitoxin system PemK/MazF family toxin [Blastococcus carthaginiensis]MDP5184227.1 type II toxin-antitoxin system PemK/MazF family toxin [Blastococcus carthaginiensis]
MSRTWPRRRRSSGTWRPCVRGEVFRLRAPREARGHEQAGSRYAVVVQSDQLPLSTWMVAPTSTSARPATFRPEVEILSGSTHHHQARRAMISPAEGRHGARSRPCAEKRAPPQEPCHASSS